MEVSIKFKNIEEVQLALIRSGKQGAIAAAKALRWEGQEAFLNSQDEVPVDTSALKQSGRLLPEAGGVITNGREVEVQIVYGSTATDYALYVHEDLTANHPHGKAKYVEDPITRQAFGISKRIAGKVEQAMKGEMR